MKKNTIRKKKKSPRKIKPQGVAVSVLILGDVVDKLYEVIEALKSQSKKSGYVHFDD